MDMRINRSSANIFLVEGTDTVVASAERFLKPYLVEKLGYDEESDIGIIPLNGREHYMNIEHELTDEELDEHIADLVRHNLDEHIGRWEPVNINKTDHLILTIGGSLHVQRSLMDELDNVFNNDNVTMEEVPFLLASTEY